MTLDLSGAVELAATVSNGTIPGTREYRMAVGGPWRNRASMTAKAAGEDCQVPGLIFTISSLDVADTPTQRYVAETVNAEEESTNHGYQLLPRQARASEIHRGELMTWTFRRRHLTQVALKLLTRRFHLCLRRLNLQMMQMKSTFRTDLDEHLIDIERSARRLTLAPIGPDGTLERRFVAYARSPE